MKESTLLKVEQKNESKEFVLLKTVHILKYSSNCCRFIIFLFYVESNDSYI